MIINQRKTGIILTYFTLILSMLSSFIIIPLIIRNLGNAEYGLYQLMTSFASYIILFDFGITATVVRYVSKYIALKDKEGQMKAASTGFLIGTIFSVIAIITGIIISLYIDKFFSNSLTIIEIEKARKLFVIVILSMGTSIFGNSFTGIIRAYERYFFEKSINILKIVIRPAIILILLMKANDSISIVLCDLFLTISILIIKIVYCKYKLKVKIKLKIIDKSIFMKFFSFSFFSLLQIISNMANNSVDKVVLGIVSGTEIVAIYAIAMQFYMIFANLSGAISNVFLPKAVQLEQKKATGEDFTDFVIKPGRLQFMLLVAILTGFTLFGQDFIVLWVGEHYLSAWTIALVIMVPQTFHLTREMCGSVIKAKKKHAFRGWVYFGIASMNIIFTIVLIKWIGYIGAPIATAIATILGELIIINIYYNNVIGINIKRMYKEIFSGTWWCAVLAAVLSLPFVLFIKGQSMIIFIIECIWFIVIYSLLLYKFSMNDFEKNLIRNPLKKRIATKK